MSYTYLYHIMKLCPQGLVVGFENRAFGCFLYWATREELELVSGQIMWRSVYKYMPQNLSTMAVLHFCLIMLLWYMVCLCELHPLQLHSNKLFSINEIHTKNLCKHNYRPFNWWYFVNKGRGFNLRARTAFSCRVSTVDLIGRTNAAKCLITDVFPCISV